MAVLLPSERANFSASGAAPSLNLPLKKDSHCFPALKLPLFVRGRSFSSVARAPRVLLTGLDWARSRAEGHSLYRYTCPMDWFLTPEIFLSLFFLSLSLSLSLSPPFRSFRVPSCPFCPSHRLQALFGLFKAPSYRKRWRGREGISRAFWISVVGPTGEIN